MDNLGERLKGIRMKQGLSLRELARQANVSPSFISQIENGKSQPSVATLYSFSQLLDISIDDLFDHKAAPSSAQRRALHRGDEQPRPHGPDPRLAAVRVLEPGLRRPPVAPTAPAQWPRA